MCRVRSFIILTQFPTVKKKKNRAPKITILPHTEKKFQRAVVFIFFFSVRYFIIVFDFTGCLPGIVIPSYGHTLVKASHPIRTAQLSISGPDQYFGRGLQGNLRCCMAFYINFKIQNTARCNFTTKNRTLKYFIHETAIFFICSKKGGLIIVSLLLVIINIRVCVCKF